MPRMFLTFSALRSGQACLPWSDHFLPEIPRFSKPASSIVANPYPILLLSSNTRLVHYITSLCSSEFSALGFPEDGSGLKIRMNKDLYCSEEVACMQRGGE